MWTVPRLFTQWTKTGLTRRRGDAGELQQRAHTETQRHRENSEVFSVACSSLCGLCVSSFLCSLRVSTPPREEQVNGGKWNTLGTWSFTAGWNKAVLSRWTTEGYYVVADAVRIR